MEGKSPSPDSERLHADKQERKRHVLNDMIPRFLANMDVQMRNGVLDGVFGQYVNEAFPLPEGFQSFSVTLMHLEMEFKI